jgi:hypothetical protein
MNWLLGIVIAGGALNVLLLIDALARRNRRRRQLAARRARDRIRRRDEHDHAARVVRLRIVGEVADETPSLSLPRDETSAAAGAAAPAAFPHLIEGGHHDP